MTATESIDTPEELDKLRQHIIAAFRLLSAARAEVEDGDVAEARRFMRRARRELGAWW